MDLRHRDYLGMYAAALVAIFIFPAVGGLLVSMGAIMVIIEALADIFGGMVYLGFGIMWTGILMLCFIGLVEGVKEWTEALAERWAKRKYSRLHSAALDLQSSSTRS